MKKTITFAVLILSTTLLTSTPNESLAQDGDQQPIAPQTIETRSDTAAMKSYFANPASKLTNIAPNHISNLNVTGSLRKTIDRGQQATLVTKDISKAFVAKKLLAETPVAEKPLPTKEVAVAETQVSDAAQVQFTQGQRTQTVELIRGQVRAEVRGAVQTQIPAPTQVRPAPHFNQIQGNIESSLNVTPPTPENSASPRVYNYRVETPRIAPAELTNYEQQEADAGFRQQAATLGPYASQTQSSNPAWVPKENRMQHVTDRFSAGGTPFAFSSGRANRNFFGVARETCCDEWQRFCNCGGLKVNPGHLGIPSLRGNDSCETCVPKKKRCNCGKCGR